MKSLMDDAEYRAATDNYNKLKFRKDQLQRDISRARTVPSCREADARSMVVGGQYLDPVAQPLVTDALYIIDEERIKLYDELQRVISAIGHQEVVVARIGARVSKAICDEHRPGYAKVVRDTIKALLVLADCRDAEVALRELLLDGNVAFASHIYPMGHRSHDFDRSQIGNALFNYIKEACENGFISKAEAARFYPLLGEVMGVLSPSAKKGN